MNTIQEFIDRLPPEEALAAIATAISGLFSQVSEDVRLNFVVNLIGEADADKVASLVQL